VKSELERAHDVRCTEIDPPSSVFGSPRDQHPRTDVVQRRARLPGRWSLFLLILLTLFPHRRIGVPMFNQGFSSFLDRFSTTAVTVVLSGYAAVLFAQASHLI
jgi:hypothetical protein